jgi:hypothetical protein
VYHRYPDRDVLVLFYRCSISSGDPTAVQCNAVAWVKPEDMSCYDFAGADLVFVKRNYSDQL